MKIVFLCGSLEPGRDGVGDYTRRLAKQVFDLGHCVGIIALSDKFIDNNIDEVQIEEETKIPTLRIPFGENLKAKFEHAKNWIDKINPDWLSLQYVIFSFHNKGLPIYFNKMLATLGLNRNWHIMLHELSVGLNVEASLTHKFWGYIQRIIIQKLLRTLKPKVVHTQSRVYKMYLDTYSIEISYLPLFANIPVTKSESLSFKIEPSTILIVIFGPIFKGGSVQDLAKEIAVHGLKEKKKICLQLIGRSGPESTLWTEIFEAEGLKVEVYGELPAVKISEILGKASFGISTTPQLLIDKSGTAAAMLEHGLPVLCISSSWTPRKKNSITVPEQTVQYTKGVFSAFTLHHHCNLNTSKINEVSRQFTSELINSQRSYPK